MATNSYGFTIKCIKQGVYATKEELIVVMSAMLKCHKGILVEYVFEEDSMGRLHIHGTMMARKGLFLSKFKKQFWQIHIDPLPKLADVENWTKYIHKCDDITENQSDYLFVD